MHMTAPRRAKPPQPPNTSLYVSQQTQIDALNRSHAWIRAAPLPLQAHQALSLLAH